MKHMYYNVHEVSDLRTHRKLPVSEVERWLRKTSSKVASHSADPCAGAFTKAKPARTHTRSRRSRHTQMNDAGLTLEGLRQRGSRKDPLGPAPVGQSLCGSH